MARLILVVLPLEGTAPQQRGGAGKVLGNQPVVVVALTGTALLRRRMTREARAVFLGGVLYFSDI